MNNFKVTDFDGAGQYIVRTKDKHIVDTGFLSTIMFKIGYQHTRNLIQHGEYNNYCIIAMSDGWTKDGWFDKNGSENTKDWTYKAFIDKQVLVDWLNSNNESYRFATQEEVVRVVMYQSDRWRN